MTQGLRALVVDDDDFSRATAVRVLRRLGAARVLEAADGDRALALAARPGECLDLVVSDLCMPRLDGIETLASLARHSPTAAFLLVSSAEPRLLRAAAAAAKRAGIAALHVMSKPLTIGKLQKTIATLLERRPTGSGPIDAAPPVAPPLLSFSPADIAHGIAAGQFTAFYQPKIDLHDRRVRGAEALIRWRHPRHGLVSPACFMPVATEHAMLDDIFFVALPTAVADYARWARAGYEGGISINLPTAALSARDLPNRLETLAATHRLDPARITFELTEDGWLGERDLACDVLTRIRIRGFGLAIDDFGTGYSGMQQLLDAPFNELKIDQGFVRAAPHDPEAAIALASIVALARELGLVTVAEGVETQAQWDVVAAAGCDQVQGFLIAHPLPADRFHAWWQADAGPGPLPRSAAG